MDRWFAYALFIWGLINVIQHALGVDAGIDKLFGEPFLTDNSPAPGRMSLLTSLCFLIGGVALVISILPTRSPKIEVVIVSLACLLGGISGSAFFCYAVDLPRIVWLGARFSEMAVHTAIGFFLLSIGLIMQRFRCGRALYQEAFRWMWAPVFFGTAFAVGSVFLGFHSQAEQSRINLANLRATFLASLLEAHDEQLKLALSRMAGRVASLEEMQQNQWFNDAKHYTSDFRSLDYLHIIYPALGFDWFYPEDLTSTFHDWLHDTAPGFQEGGTISVSILPEDVTKDKFCYWVFETEAMEEGPAEVLLVAVVDHDRFVADATQSVLENLGVPIEYSVREEAYNLSKATPHVDGVAFTNLSADVRMVVTIDPRTVHVDRRIEVLFLIGGLAIAAILASLVHLIYLNRQRYKELEIVQLALTKQKNRLEAYVTNAPAAVAMFDRRMRYLAVSDQWKRDYNLENEKLIGRCHYDVFPKISEEWKAIHRRGMAGEIAFKEKDQWRPDGWEHDQYLRWEIRPWSDINDTIGGIMMFTADITKDVLREEELEAMREKAEAANHAKTNFLANMSHEIRTPMNSILGFAELLSNEISDPRQSQFIRSIQSSGKTLLGLINDLLDLAKIEAGKIELAPKPISLRRHFRELQDVFQLQADVKGIKLAFTIQEGLPEYLVMDDFRLQQVLLNLLSNAVKFTDKGSVSLELSYVENAGAYDVKFSVTDTGCGIPESFRERAFNKFEQVGDSAHGGTGLGLAISSKLVKLMGGEIDFKSKVLEGTTFFFTLPGIPLVTPSVDPTEMDDDKHHRLVFPRAKILIIEDIPANMELMRAVFEDVPNVQIIEATGGRMGLELAVEHRPDMILLDISMPDMDGREVCQRLRQMADFSQTPIVAVTASMQRTTDILLEFGFDECLFKPIPPHILLKTCHRWLHGSVEARTPAPFKPLGSSSEDEHPSISDDELNELLVELKRHQNGFKIDELKQLAERIETIAQEHSATYLHDLGMKLKLAAETFDVAGVKQALAGLNNYLISIKIA